MEFDGPDRLLEYGVEQDYFEIWERVPGTGESRSGGVRRWRASYLAAAIPCTMGDVCPSAQHAPLDVPQGWISS